MVLGVLSLKDHFRALVGLWAGALFGWVRPQFDLLRTLGLRFYFVRDTDWLEKSSPCDDKY